MVVKSLMIILKNKKEKIIGNYIELDPRRE